MVLLATTLSVYADTDERGHLQLSKSLGASAQKTEICLQMPSFCVFY